MSQIGKGKINFMKKNLNFWSQKTCPIKKMAGGVCVTHSFEEIINVLTGFITWTSFRLLG